MEWREDGEREGGREGGREEGRREEVDGWDDMRGRGVEESRGWRRKRGGKGKGRLFTDLRDRLP